MIKFEPNIKIKSSMKYIYIFFYFNLQFSINYKNFWESNYKTILLRQ